jgi:phosphoglycerate dehydrogenase-like enzyme
MSALNLYYAACLSLQGIGMEVVAYNIQKNPAVGAMGVKYVSIEDALPWADVVSVHVPLLKLTHHFINSDRCTACGHVIVHSIALTGCAVLASHAMLA